METRSKNGMIFTFILGLFLVSCKSNEQKIDPYKLCLEFYELNNQINTDELLNVQILGVREYSKYDNSIHKYDRIPTVIGINDSISDKNIKLPSFSKNADMDEKRLFYTRCDSVSLMYLKNKYKINLNDDIFNIYIKEVESIYSSYYQIKVPHSLPYRNVELRGNGNYVEFILYKDAEKKSNINVTMLRIRFFQMNV